MAAQPFADDFAAVATVLEAAATVPVAVGLESAAALYQLSAG